MQIYGFFFDYKIVVHFLPLGGGSLAYIPFLADISLGK